ncbi:hypothetical protein GV829_13280 [Sphingomonas lacunae]|uniref:DUF4175 domain-containing protein n=1 Tax=Sphingomonas lacunae TaxID=2698828 RepID=A0A6M4AVX4_9SPHN|nr:hypothetical protein [Sphingomonas lacunae]QJQ33288.1 hypothetical protein GV829_13280 [Sphingomonas lacunae]
MNRSRSLSTIFGWPLLILVTGLAGLVIALTGDGWRDVAAWIALSVPVLAVIRAMRARHR